MKVSHSFEVHSNESACRKMDVLGLNKSTVTPTRRIQWEHSWLGNKKEKKDKLGKHFHYGQEFVYPFCYIRRWHSHKGSPGRTHII